MTVTHYNHARQPGFGDSALRSSVLTEIDATLQSAPLLPIELNNLNTLRFVAAMAVVLEHIEMHKADAGLPSAMSAPAMGYAGYLAVKFFFVLSGFLITFLLFKERAETKTINVRAFYVRRILRIWPLYFLTVALGFIALPMLHFRIPVECTIPLNHRWTDFFLFLVFLPNVPPLLGAYIPGAGPCWSLGVEEQFYAIWPLLAKRFLRNPLKLFVAVICVQAVLVRSAHLTHHAFIYNYLQNFWIESMAFGAIAAYYFTFAQTPARKQERVLSVLSGGVAIAVWLLLGCNPAEILWPALFAVIIIGAANSRPLGGPLYSPLNYLGKLSFSIYMLHDFAALIAVNFVARMAPLPAAGSNALIYLVSLSLSFGAALCSYKFLEVPILRMKAKFAPRPTMRSPEHSVRLLAPELSLSAR